MTGACSGHPGNLWDSTLPKETDAQRDARHRRALAFCAICPVTEWCESTIQNGDDGVRAGRVLPHIEDKYRRSAYSRNSEAAWFFQRLQPERIRRRAS